MTLAGAELSAQHPIAQEIWLVICGFAARIWRFLLNVVRGAPNCAMLDSSGDGPSAEGNGAAADEHGQFL